MINLSRCTLVVLPCLALSAPASGAELRHAAPSGTAHGAPVVAGTFRVAAVEAERALAQAVARYRGIVARGGWLRISAGPWLRPGGDDARLPRIRKRLAISGDLVVVGDPARTGYDFWTTAAVMRFQARHGLPVDGFVDRRTIAAMNVTAEVRLAQLERSLGKIRSHRMADPQSCLFVHRPAFKPRSMSASPSVWLTRYCDGGSAAATRARHAGAARRASERVSGNGLHLSAWVASDTSVHFRAHAQTARRPD